MIPVAGDFDTAVSAFINGLCHTYSSIESNEIQAMIV